MAVHPNPKEFYCRFPNDIIMAAYKAGKKLFGKELSFSELRHIGVSLVTKEIVKKHQIDSGTEGICYVGEYGYVFYWNIKTNRFRAIDCESVCIDADGAISHNTIDDLIKNTRKSEVLCVYVGEENTIDVYLDSWGK